VQIRQIVITRGRPTIPTTCIRVRAVMWECGTHTDGRDQYTPCLKNVPPLACYNFDAREWILIFLAEMLPIK